MEQNKKNGIVCLTEDDPSHYKQLMAVYNYWRTLLGDRRMPARSDFDPARVARQLPLISLIDVLEEGLDFRFRLVGSLVESMLLSAPTGLRLSEFVHQESAKAAAELYKLVLANRCPAFQAGRMHHEEQGHQRYAFLALPLSTDGETIDIILTVSEFPNLKYE